MSDYKCWYCGNEVAWVGDFMESEIGGMETDEEGRIDRVVGLYTYPHCGSDFEFRQGPKEMEHETGLEG